MRIELNTKKLLLSAGIALFITGITAGANAQAPDPGSGSPSGSDEQPLLLMVQNHGQISAKSQQEWNVLLSDTLKESLSQSSHFRLMILSPLLPVVKTALREHAIAMADLVEPYQKETLERLAMVFGAKYILSFGAFNGKDELSVTARFEQNPNSETWIVTSAQDFTSSNKMGKRKLKKIELIDLAVDKITATMGFPSHLAEGLVTSVEVKEKVKKPKPVSADKPAVPAGGDTATGNDTKTPPVQDEQVVKKITPEVPPSIPAKNVTVNKKTDDAVNKKIEDSSRSKSPAQPEDKQTAKPGLPPRGKSAIDVDTTKPTDPVVRFTTDTSPSHVPPTHLPEISPPPAESKIDFEVEAARFRQSGDLANGILSLRRAINERPKDIALRRMLIQGYQDLHMNEEAYQESSRARRIAPKDSSLLRLQGDSLLARGDNAGAIKSYLEAAELDPNDIDSQVALGNALLSEQQFAEAVNAYQKAAKNAPKSPLPHRRLARAFLGRAGGDSKQYTSSLDEIKLARDLTPKDDRENYADDYLEIMQVMGVRLKELTDQLQNIYQGQISSQLTPVAAKRALASLKERAESGSNYLDGVPPAAAQDSTHASFQQSAALLLQALSLYSDFLQKGSTSTEEAYKSAQLDTFRALSAARERLSKIKLEHDTPKPPDNGSTR